MQGHHCYSTQEVDLAQLITIKAGRALPELARRSTLADVEGQDDRHAVPYTTLTTLDTSFTHRQKVS